MDWNTITFDWNQARAFLVAAEEGSLSAAARALGLAQPTLSRQVAALEHKLGVVLFERTGRALVLTASGTALLEHVRAMAHAANAVALAAGGHAETVEGKVSITATDLASTYVLPPILAHLAQKAPGISVEVVASNAIRNLQRREADIALRNAEPTEPDLIARRLRNTTGHIYTTQRYLDRFGPITTVSDLQRANWIGFGSPEEMVRALAPLGLELSPSQFTHYSGNGNVVVGLLQAGLGVSVLTRDMMPFVPEAVEIVSDFPAVPIPLWLITHRELHTSPRIRVVWDTLVEHLSRAKVAK